MSYTIFPSDPLPQFVFTLCRTVNIAPYCHPSWKVSGIIKLSETFCSKKRFVKEKVDCQRKLGRYTPSGPS